MSSGLSDLLRCPVKNAPTACSQQIGMSAPAPLSQPLHLCSLATAYAQSCTDVAPTCERNSTCLRSPLSMASRAAGHAIAEVPLAASPAYASVRFSLHMLIACFSCIQSRRRCERGDQQLRLKCCGPEERGWLLRWVDVHRHQPDNPGRDDWLPVQLPAGHLPHRLPVPEEHRRLKAGERETSMAC